LIPGLLEGGSVLVKEARATGSAGLLIITVGKLVRGVGRGESGNKSVGGRECEAFKVLLLAVHRRTIISDGIVMVRAHCNKT
jgi:hypothetical protein